MGLCSLDLSHFLLFSLVVYAYFQYLLGTKHSEYLRVIKSDITVFNKTSFSIKKDILRNNILPRLWLKYFTSIIA